MRKTLILAGAAGLVLLPAAPLPNATFCATSDPVTGRSNPLTGDER
jgi:hypothetical protein